MQELQVGGQISHKTLSVGSGASARWPNEQAGQWRVGREGGRAAVLPCGLVLSGTRADIHLRFTLSWRQLRASRLEKFFPALTALRPICVRLRLAASVCQRAAQTGTISPCVEGRGRAQWPQRTKLDGTGLPGPGACWHPRNSWRGCDW